jgi:hypothetical protein
MTITCFRYSGRFGCVHPDEAGSEVPVDALLAQVAHGHAKCPICRRDEDLRLAMRHFPAFGKPEALFGLDTWHGMIERPPTDEAYIHVEDLALHLPNAGRVLWFNQTPNMNNPKSGLDLPCILATQNMHHGWPLTLRVFIPKSKEPVKLSVSFVVAPKEPMDPPLEVAVRAVGHFHRREWSTAAVLLCASVEASLRRRVKAEYATRKVTFESRQMTLSQLVERARLLLAPMPGPKLMDDLKALGAHRNPAAHGDDEPEITEEQIADWMVAAATVYEWAKHAKSVYDPPTPS